MSQPCSFTTSIHMTPDAYGRLMRGKLLDPLARAIADIIVNGSNDIVVFNYLKKEQALFAHFYFHYPVDLDAILQDPGICAVLRIVELKDSTIADRAVVSHDASNFRETETTAGFVLEQGGYRRADTFDVAEIDLFDGLINKHFFKFGDVLSSGGAQWLKNHRIVDGKLRRKAERHLEARRLQIAKARIPHATPFDPVRLCNGYHYNGHFVLNTGGGLRPLPQIDPGSFRQTDYGAADAQHVVVSGCRVLRTDPALFRMLSKGETTFYASVDNVFDAGGNPVPDADPKTFRLVHYAFARDKARWYTFRGVALEDVGDQARIEDALYFSDICLLIGTGAVYLGATRLPLEASSCRLKRAKQLRDDPCFGGLLWLCDDTGDCIVSTMSRYGQQQDVRTLRTTTPEASWDEEMARWERFVASPGLPWHAMRWDMLRKQGLENLESDDARQAFTAYFEAWYENHFEGCWSDDPHNNAIWEAISKYFDCLLKLGMPRKIVPLYERIRSNAWFHPRIFGAVARAFIALDQPDRAVEEIKSAIIYDVYGIRDLLDSEDLAPLAGRPDMMQLSSYHDFLEGVARYRPLSGDLARYFLEARPARLQSVIGNSIIRGRFYIPPATLRARLCGGDAARIASYEQAMAAFINGCMLNDDIRRAAAYDARGHYQAWGDLSGLHPAVHLIVASELYAEGFFWIDQNATEPKRREFHLAALALARAKEMLESDAHWADDEVWRRFSADPVYAPLLALAEPVPQS